MNDILFILIPASSIIWSLIFLASSLCKIKIYKVTGTKLINFQTHIKYSSIENNDEHFGWFMGKYFIGYIHKTNDQHSSVKELYVLTSENCFKRCSENTPAFHNDDYIDILHQKSISQSNTYDICCTTDRDDGSESRLVQMNYVIDLYDREGTFWDIKYTKYPYHPLTYEVRQPQQSAIRDIMRSYNEKKYCVALLHGKPGTGKSIISIILAKHLIQCGLEVSLVDTFKPWEPNDSFTMLYHTINPTREKPLIVVIEEVDKVIDMIHNTIMKKHDHFPTMVMCKGDWNSFLDKFDRRRYTHVFFIMTSNRDITYFNDLDPSYMRPGRVNVIAEVT